MKSNTQSFHSFLLFMIKQLPSIASAALSWFSFQKSKLLPPPMLLDQSHYKTAPQKRWPRFSQTELNPSSRCSFIMIKRAFCTDATSPKTSFMLLISSALATQEKPRPWSSSLISGKFLTPYAGPPSLKSYKLGGSLPFSAHGSKTSCTLAKRLFS